jgi:carbamoyl-phosphate synthase large subunit
LECIRLEKPGKKSKRNNVVEFISKKKIDLAIIVPSEKVNSTVTATDGYKMRRCAVDFGIPLITNLQQAILLGHSLCKAQKQPEVYNKVKSWREYLEEGRRL